MKEGLLCASGGCIQNAKKRAFWRWYGQRSKCAVLQREFRDFHSKEFQILMLLAQNKGHVFSKEQIYNIVWQELYSGDYNIVMSHIHNIREKIEVNPSEPVYIQTVWLETR